MKLMSLTSFSSGFCPEGLVEFAGASFAMFDYEGKSDPIPCLRMTFKDPEGNDYIQNYSAGDPKAFAPTPDGKGMQCLGDREKTSDGSNMGKFMESLFKAGFPVNRIETNDITPIVGTKAYISIHEITRKGGDDYKGKKTQNLVLVDKVESLPGEAEQKAAAESSDETTKIAIAAVTECLDDPAYADGISKRELTSKVMLTSAMKDLDKATRTATLTIIRNDKFLKGSDVWMYEKGKVVYG